MIILHFDLIYELFHIYFTSLHICKLNLQVHVKIFSRQVKIELIFLSRLYCACTCGGQLQFYEEKLNIPVIYWWIFKNKLTVSQN